MGWRADGGLWLLVRGGGLYLSKGTGASERSFSSEYLLIIIHLVGNILNSSALIIRSFGWEVILGVDPVIPYYMSALSLLS